MTRLVSLPHCEDQGKRRRKEKRQPGIPMHIHPSKMREKAKDKRKEKRKKGNGTEELSYVGIRANTVQYPDKQK